jgi:hypothetical protein
MIAAAIGFAVGLIIGVIACIIAAIAILNRPPPERTQPIYSAICKGPARTTGPESAFDFIQRRLK